MLDPAIRDLAATGANFGTLAEHLLINTEMHRAKYKAIQQHPDVTVTIWDAADPYRYVEVRGTVNGQVRGDAAREHIDALSRRYTGHDYTGTIESERVVLRIDPVRQRVRLT